MYQIRIIESAAKELRKIDPVWKKRIIQKLEILAEEPSRLSPNIKQLKGEYHDFQRLRVGDYRVIYKILEAEIVILVIRIAHRREVYL
jgi:mRNA interferase RelE/StbE